MYPDLAKCREYCKVAEDKAVLYYRVGDHKLKPQNFANSLPDGVLLRESFPSAFVRHDPSIKGCRTFKRRASQAFAEKTVGVAYVLLPTDACTDITERVWTDIEKPVLIASNGACTRIIKVDPDQFERRCVLWDRLGLKDAKMPSCIKENGPIPYHS